MSELTTSVVADVDRLFRIELFRCHQDIDTILNRFFYTKKRNQRKIYIKAMFRIYTHIFLYSFNYTPKCYIQAMFWNYLTSNIKNS